jgi:hypothetical protein
MDRLPDPASIGGALRFLAQLSAAARECAADETRVDELTARRRRRIVRASVVRTEVRQVKAL